jgi:hypothetical protein
LPVLQLAQIWPTGLDISNRYSSSKVIFEDQNFRVIAATWKKGTTDTPHSHPLPLVVYPLTDCNAKLLIEGLRKAALPE